jgi:putative ABC transport system substrate-binding protein
MKEKIFVWLVATLFLTTASLAQAQQHAKVPKIGWVGFRSASDPSPGREAFKEEFRALGYLEGKNIANEYRFADGKVDRLPATADELVRFKVDVIVAPSTPSALAAKNATKTIPIVFYDVSDPVAAGLVDSLARPGGTLRGSPTLTPCWLANAWS